MAFPSGEVAIVGVYESPRRKAPGVHPFAIQAECILGALADAGLELGDVDGFATAASFPSEGGLQMSVCEVAEYMAIHPRWFDSTDIGGAAFISHAGHAALAIASGMADVVVVSYAAAGYSGIPEIPFADYGSNAAGPGQFEIPYGPSTVSTYALAATRHMHEFGTTPEQLAQIAVHCRGNAANNPDARFRDPIEVADVLASPMIATPLHRLDCCIVSDSGGAFVMVSKRKAEQLAQRGVYLLGWGEALGQLSMNQMWPFTETAAVHSGARAFESAGLKPADIDVAQVYDSFTITVLLTLESLGFCAKGEGGAFVESGALQFNTDGGGLSSNHPGRRGVFTVIEGVRQLRGTSPGVQLDDPKTCLVSGTGGSLSATATMILGV